MKFFIIFFFLVSLVINLILIVVATVFYNEAKQENKKRVVENLKFTRWLQDSVKLSAAEKKVIKTEKKQLPINQKQYKSNAGIEHYNTVYVKPGDYSYQERKNKKSNYQIQRKIYIREPKPLLDVRDIEQNNRELGAIFPAFYQMVKTAVISPYFKQLYHYKYQYILAKLSKKENPLTKHHLYDCQTILQMQHPTTKQKVLWLQADMDIVSDGTDGDRQPVMDQAIINSSNYQPFTSYSWRKTTNNPNPLLKKWQHKRAKIKQNLTKSQHHYIKKKKYQQQLQKINKEINSMQKVSFLLAKKDPFIVVPSFMLKKQINPLWQVKVGDYAIVVYQQKIYPAIVGDAGPNFKIGEASLRLAKAINSQVTPYRRPTDNNDINYFIFPNTGLNFAQRTAPNYQDWHKACADLISEIGGMSPHYQLHNWQ